MRLHFENTTRPRLVAKALRKALAKLDRPRQLAECQEIVARMFGYRRWDELDKLHGTGPVSADDPQAPTEAAARRLQYGDVLRQAGIPVERIGAILDAVRPSDRSATPEISELPKLRVEAFETDVNGEHIRSLGMQDLSWVVLAYMVPYRAVRMLPAEPLVSSLHGGLSEEARDVGYAGRLALPGLAAAVDRFIERIGGLDAVRPFKERLDDIRRQEDVIEQAERELTRIRKASFSEDFSKLHFVYLSHEDKYLGDFGDAYNDWGWDGYVARHPRPPIPWEGEDAAAYEAWQKGYTAFVRASAPPYVYATTPEPWNGVDPDDIRIAIEEQEEGFDLDNLLSNEMEEHYEDAYCDIVAPGELEALIKKWTKRGMDFETFTREVASWNARQAITSYYPDYAIAMPAFPGKTKADAIAWCEADLAAEKRKYAELQKWAAPAQEPDLESAAPGG
jgi:hypothetical protein